jgi:hypothetical protein
MSDKLYLLDTNILVHFARDSDVWKNICEVYNPLTIDPTPKVSFAHRTIKYHKNAMNFNINH